MDRIGKTRIRLAKILNRDLDLNCQPEDLKPAGGRARNRSTLVDAYAWEVFTRKKSGLGFVAGSFDTMTECIKAGKVKLSHGEIYADWTIKKGTKNK